MSRLDTKAIRARADAAFKGPWRYGRFTVECDRHLYEDCAGDGQHEIVRVEAPHEYPASETDAQVVAEVLCDVPGLEVFAKAHGEFIAHAREDVPALCVRVDELEAALREIRCAKYGASPLICSIAEEALGES